MKDMKDTTTVKVLLTILTLVLMVVIPIWIGPETIHGEKTLLFFEWFFGLFLLMLIIMGGSIIWVIGTVIYEAWDDIV